METDASSGWRVQLHDHIPAHHPLKLQQAAAEKHAAYIERIRARGMPRARSAAQLPRRPSTAASASDLEDVKPKIPYGWTKSQGSLGVWAVMKRAE